MKALVLEKKLQLSPPPPPPPITESKEDLEALLTENMKLLDDRHKDYYSNGQLKEEGNYKDGEKVDIGKVFDFDGNEVSDPEDQKFCLDIMDSFDDSNIEDFEDIETGFEEE